MGRKWLRVGVICAVLAACAGDGRAGGADSASVNAEQGDSDSIQSLSWRFSAPESWDDRVVIAEDPDGAVRLEQEGIHSARLFNYLPYDTTVVPQTLLGVYAYDSTAWARLEREGGPPQGVLIRRGPGVAYVVGFPQSNPFRPGSRDSVEFDRRGVTMESVRSAFRVVR